MQTSRYRPIKPKRTFLDDGLKHCAAYGDVFEDGLNIPGCPHSVQLRDVGSTLRPTSAKTVVRTHPPSRSPALLSGGTRRYLPHRTSNNGNSPKEERGTLGRSSTVVAQRRLDGRDRRRPYSLLQQPDRVQGTTDTVKRATTESGLRTPGTTTGGTQTASGTQAQAEGGTLTTTAERPPRKVDLPQSKTCTPAQALYIPSSGVIYLGKLEGSTACVVSGPYVQQLKLFLRTEVYLTDNFCGQCLLPSSEYLKYCPYCSDDEALCIGRQVFEWPTDDLSLSCQPDQEVPVEMFED